MNPRLLRTAPVACLLAGLIAGAIASPAAAEPVFLVRNEAALSRTTALPKLGQALVLDAKEFSTRFAIDWSNEYVQRRNANEALTLDGETGHLDWGLRYGIAPGLELGIDVPLLLTGGGTLDGLIEGWHSAFGLANGGRERVARNQYRYRYTRNGVTLLYVDHGASGFGDVELNAGVALSSALALRALVKLPTGSERKLSGGNSGGAVWFDFDPFEDSTRWFGFVSGGVSYNEKSAVLPAQQEQLVGLAGLGVGFRVVRRVALVAQLYGHTALYRYSEINALTRPGGQLLFGGRIGVAPKLSVDLGVQEDVSVNSSPDFGIHVGLNYH
ncbi:MAG: DUF3187 family protein [Nevskia sp.]